MARTLLSTCVLMLGLAACSAPGPDDGQISPAPTPPVTDAGLEPQLRLEPSSLSSCDPTSIKVRWDVPESRGITAVDVNVVTSGDLFAQGGAQGESTTGEWVRPGTRFVLLDRSTRAELASAAIGGPDCGSEADD